MKYSVLFYEIARCFFILTTHGEFSIELLPLSWYAAAPLLIIPVILAIPAFSGNAPHCRDFYIYTKILSIPGLIIYILRDYKYALAAAALNNLYSLERLIAVVLFLLFDVIIMLVLFIKTKKTEGNSCK